MLPVVLELRGRCVLVVGGGSVGLRKAAAARTGGATVRVVDPAPPPAGWNGGDWVREHYHDGHLAGVCLVFAAASTEVNARVVADAGRRGLLVNSATAPAAGDFTLPATLRRGGLTVAVTTSGAAPALARRIRDKLEADFDESFASWVRLLERIRSLVLERIADADHRRDMLEGFADWPWLERLRTDGEIRTWAAMERTLTEGQNGSPVV